MAKKIHGPSCVAEEDDIAIDFELPVRQAKEIERMAAERGVCQCVIIREAMDALRAELEKR